jgi:hypothetical protein
MIQNTNNLFVQQFLIILNYVLCEISILDISLLRNELNTLYLIILGVLLWVFMNLFKDVRLKKIKNANNLYKD